MYRHATALTQYLWIKTPPHQWPIKPSDGCKSSSEACHPNSPSRVEKPYMIFGFLVVDVGNVVVVLLLRFLVFAGAVADQKAREKTICEWFYNHIMESHEDPPSSRPSQQNCELFIPTVMTSTALIVEFRRRKLIDKTRYFHWYLAAVSALCTIVMQLRERTNKFIVIWERI